MSYDYFDEAYFERGEERGTAYSNYRSNARSSLIYRELAEACAALKPKRALEIGCATGIIVSHLNGMGIETHGIDVSEWAIRHREHSNVRLAGAEKLPFPDDYFDLIYSVHALEHIPEALAAEAFAEIKRVSNKNAVQFHTLPIIGLGPYQGDPITVITALKKDPTHNLLFDKAWWLERFGEIGFEDLGTALLFRHEMSFDLGVSQLFLISSGEERMLRLDQVRRWNSQVMAGCLSNIRSLREGVFSPGPAGNWLYLSLPGHWADVESEANFYINDNTLFTATVILKSATPATLRFCFLSKDGIESDLIRGYHPGSISYQFSKADLYQRLGEAGRVRRVLFGGEGLGSAEVTLMALDGDKVVFKT